MLSSAGRRVKLIREKLGLTQAEFGATLNLPWHKIKDIETGKHKLTPEIAYLIEQKYSVDFRWLLTGEGPMMRTDSGCRPPPTEVQPEDIVEEKILLMLKGMDEEKKRDVLKYIQEKKLLMELLEEREKAQRKIS